MGRAGSEGAETKFHVFIFCPKPVAERPFTFEDEFDYFPKEKLKQNMLFLLLSSLHFVPPPASLPQHVIHHCQTPPLGIRSLTSFSDRLCVGEWSYHEDLVWRVLQGCGGPIQEGLASYTATMPLPAYEPVTVAVCSAQCAYS